MLTYFIKSVRENSSFVILTQRFTITAVMSRRRSHRHRRWWQTFLTYIAYIYVYIKYKLIFNVRGQGNIRIP